MGLRRAQRSHRAFQRDAIADLFSVTRSPILRLGAGRCAAAVARVRLGPGLNGSVPHKDLVSSQREQRNAPVASDDVAHRPPRARALLRLLRRGGLT